MKTLLAAVTIVATALLVGGVWLYATPQRTTTPPIQVQQPPREASPTSTLPNTIPAAGHIVATSTQPVLMAFATSTHTIGIATTTAALITVGTTTLVTVTIPITDPSLISNSVNLLQLGAAGTQPTILGVMQGAGSGIYTIQQSFSPPSAGEIQLQVSAAFQGSLKRVLSNVISVSVWSVLSDPTAAFMVRYPPDVYLTNNDTSSDIFYLDSSPYGVAIGGTPDAGSSEATSGYRIAISATPVSPFNTFDINQYLSTEYPYSQVSSVTSTSIGGVSGYIVTFTQEENAGHPNAIVYRNGYVFEIVYVSTDGGIPSFSDQVGLNDFAQILNTFTFTN
jgi:hypothetical protein